MKWVLSVAGAQESIWWEVQRYDGWYNNLLHHSHGSVGECQALGTGRVGWGQVSCPLGIWLPLWLRQKPFRAEPEPGRQADSGTSRGPQWSLDAPESPVRAGWRWQGSPCLGSATFCCWHNLEARWCWISPRTKLCLCEITQKIQGREDPALFSRHFCDGQGSQSCKKPSLAKINMQLKQDSKQGGRVHCPGMLNLLIFCPAEI